ncbi:MAG TPA: S9 family peptidase [bacterium]|jgi:dipeptidyl aminopeptidase/acylaminoacyl peptidase
MTTRKITIEDLLALKWIGDPQLSPDGTRIVYVLTAADREANTYRSHLWIVPVGAGEPRQFTWGEHRDTNPRWSPDGRSIVFISDRGAKSEPGAKKPKQLFVIPTDGGEARLLVDAAFAPADPAWSPDGATIAFVGKPEASKPDSDVKVITRIRYKNDGEGFWDGRYKHIFTIPAAGGSPRQLTFGDFDHLDPAWSPDGSMLACAANRTREGDLTNIADIWVVPVSGGPSTPSGAGAPRQLTASTGPAATPAWSPDGKWIAYLGHDNAAMGATNTGLWLLSAGGGVMTNLTAAFDRSLAHHVISDMRAHPKIGGPRWSADSAQIFFLIADGATNQIGVIDAAGGSVRVLTSGRHEIFGYAIDLAGTTGVIAVSDPSHPGDLWVGRINSSGALVDQRRVTAVNQDVLGELTLSMPERFEYEGADGWPVEGWVMRPVEFRDGDRYPTVLEIHGGPHGAYGEAFFHEFQLLAAEGFAVVFVNPRGSQGYGQRFTAATQHDWGGKDYQDIMLGLDAALARYAFLDPDRLGVAGGSYGGFMTNWMIGHSDRFKAAVTMRSISNHLSQWGTSDLAFMKGFWEFPGDPWEDPIWYWEHSPLAYVEKITTPLLILHSDEDLRCPIPEAEQLFAALYKLGRKVVFVRFPHESHDLSRNGKPSHRLERLRWIVRWMTDHLATVAPAPPREPIAAGGEASL